MTRTLAAGVALLALLGADWERVGERDGVTIDARDTGGSPLHELRLTARSPVSPAEIMATLWRHDEYPQFLPYLKRLDVLRDDGDTKVIYEQIRVPVVKDRDMTLRVSRTSSAETGGYEVKSVAVPDEGPPESRQYVRIRTSEAHWRLAPAPDGGTDVTYTICADAGGLLPAWIVDVVEKDAAVKILRAMLDRARRNAH